MLNTKYFRWTVDEYFTYEQQSQEKHEFLDGYVYRRSAINAQHSRISSHLIGEVGLSLHDTDYWLYGSDLQIQIDASKIVYSDLSIAYGQGELSNSNQTELLNPILVCEVMSPSSIGYDQGLKAQFYRSLSSLKYYFLVDQSRVYVQLQTLQADGWLIQEFTDLDVTLSLDEIGVQLPISQIYRDIEFENKVED